MKLGDHRMHIASIGIDLGKTTFHLEDADQKLTRLRNLIHHSGKSGSNCSLTLNLSVNRSN